MADEKTLAVRNTGEVQTWRANGTIREYRYVKIDTTDDNSVQECDSEEESCGVSMEASTDGFDIKVQMSGRAKMTIGSGGLTSGGNCNSDADGKAVSETTTDRWIGGTATQDGDENDVKTILIRNFYLSTS